MINSLSKLEMNIHPFFMDIRFIAEKLKILLLSLIYCVVKKVNYLIKVLDPLRKILAGLNNCFINKVTNSSEIS